MKVAERFEKRVVLNASRGLLLVLGGVSFAAAVAAILYFGYGLIPAMKGESPPPPSKPQLVHITAEELRARLPKQKTETEKQTAYFGKQRSTAKPAPGGKDRSEQAASDPLNSLLEQVRALFPGEKIAWEDATFPVCARKNYWGGGCRRWTTKTVRGFETKLRKQVQGAALEAQTQYLQAVVAWLPQVDEDKREKVFSRYLEISGNVDVLTSFAKEFAQLLQFVPGSWSVYLTKGIVKSLPNEVITPSFVTALKRSREVVASVLDDHRTDALLLTARFIDGGLNGAPMPAPVVQNMKTLVDQVEEPLRLQAVIEFRRAFKEKTAAEEQQYAAALAQVRHQEADLQRAYEEARAKKSQSRRQGLMAIGVTLAALAVVGWLLAMLAIERNTRALLELGKASGEALEAPPPTISS